MARNPGSRGHGRWLLLGLAVAALLATPACGADDSCAAACTAAVVSVVREELTSHAAAAEFARFGPPPYSMLQIKQVAADHGVQLEGRTCTLDEALSCRAPVILALQNPDHFVVALNQDPASIQVWDGDRVLLATPEDLSRRFRGVGLFPVLPAAAGPRVSVEQAHAEVADVGLGQKVVHDFPLGNMGDAPLVVELEGSPCCGADAALDVSEVGPGGTAHLIVGVTVSRVGGRFLAIRVRTNDPQRRLLVFTLAAETPPGLGIWPQRVELVADDLPGAPVPQAILTLTTTKDVLAVELSSDAPWLTASAGAVEETPTSTVRQFRIEAAQPGPPGVREGHVTITPSLPEGPSHTVPVRLTVRPNAVVRPAWAFFGLVKQGARVPPKRVDLGLRSGGPFRVLGAEASDKRITARAVRSPAGWACEITVSTKELGALDGEVVLSTDIPHEESIRIPVRVHVLPR